MISTCIQFSFISLSWLSIQCSIKSTKLQRTEEERSNYCFSSKNSINKSHLCTGGRFAAWKLIHCRLGKSWQVIHRDEHSSDAEENWKIFCLVREASVVKAKRAFGMSKQIFAILFTYMQWRTQLHESQLLRYFNCSSWRFLVKFNPVTIAYSLSLSCSWMKNCAGWERFVSEQFFFLDFIIFFQLFSSLMCITQMALSRGFGIWVYSNRVISSELSSLSSNWMVSDLRRDCSLSAPIPRLRNYSSPIKDEQFKLKFHFVSLICDESLPQCLGESSYPPTSKSPIFQIFPAQEIEGEK